MNTLFRNALILLLSTELILAGPLKICPDVITRKQWGGARPLSVAPLQEDPAPYIVVHHSATRSCNTTETCKALVKSIQNYHVNDLKWNDIGYNFLIGGDGNIYEGRGWGVCGAHLVKYNARSIGICLLGNFQESEPPRVVLEALKNLIECSVETSKTAENYHLIGHRQGTPTLCPGEKLFEEIETWPHFVAHPSDP